MESPRNVILGILIEMAGILDTSKRRTISSRDVDELVQGEPVDLGVARLTVSVWTGDAALAERIDRMIRALDPEPGAWTTREGKRIKLLAARNENGTLRLTRIQREGEKPKEL